MTVTEADILNIPQILEKIGPKELQVMQKMLQSVRMRFAFEVPLLDAEGQVQRDDTLYKRAGVFQAMFALLDKFCIWWLS